jgi:tRNA A-37 threonylcarbamoyl transferase component Bud32
VDAAGTLDAPADVEDEQLSVWSVPPQKLGEYEVIEKIGEGGMGVVYKVRDVALDRVVALKMIRHFGSSDGAAMDRFFRAARVTARLRHPSIVPIFQVGQVDGTPYVVSQFIEGRDLSAIAGRSGRLPAREAAGIAAQVAEALHFAHEHDVIHRDVKPSNIMIQPDSHALLTDFGLARPVATCDEASVTMEGLIVGTPSYMSPEQAEGRQGAMGPASDVYSLGATLYTILAGRPPFQGRSPMETMRLVCEVEPEAPSRLEQTVPRDLDAICLKALSKGPAARYGSARAMADDLHRFLEGRPIVARTPGAAERLARWVMRHPARIAAIVLAVVALALFANQQFELQKARSRVAAEDRRALRHAVNRAHETELRSGIERDENRIRNGGGNREDRARLATSYDRLGDLLINTDRLADAALAYARTVSLLCQLLRGKPEGDARRVELVGALAKLGESRWALGRSHDAKVAYREAVMAGQSLLADHPEVTAYRDDLARTLNRLNQLSATTRPGVQTYP